ncbi:MAG: sugar phosphate isomerase/epimerase [Planctomycetota bacterium]|jgi:sugar phosphate isomerase/epimerase|nr:sugar phosphate isomerase/epimerase [Planctomycetota bacterium]MDP6504261.1 sugar phosphate isomerase/epimerase [Planctomycetota bacterium]
MKAKIGLIPGIIREEVQADLWGTLERAAEIGYQGLEGGNVLAGDIEGNRKRLDDIGLQAIAIGAQKEQLAEDIGKLIDDASALGTAAIVLYHAPMKTRDDVMADADLFDTAGEKIAKAGLKFCYHNHDHEFKNVFDGQHAIDILLENTDPEHVYWELDAAWVLYGGEDPIEYLKRYTGRIPLMHLKDLADINERGKFCAVGTGVLDVRGVVETSVETGVDWAIVEQDRALNLTPMESVTASFLNIKELGLV